MCFSPQRHTIFGHQNFQKCSRTVSFFYILTSECAFRHIGMQFFDIWTSKSGPRPWLFLHLKCAFRHSGVQIFDVSSAPNWVPVSYAFQLSTLSERDFRNCSNQKLPKRAFRVPPLQLKKTEASTVVRLPCKTWKWPLTLRVLTIKTSFLWETSFKFHTFNSKIHDFLRVFLIKRYVFLRSLRHFSKKSPKPAPATIFAVVSRLRGESAPSPQHKMLRLPRHCERPHHKVLCLPRQNDALAFTRFESIVPVTQNTKMSLYFLIWGCQNEHLVRDFFHFFYFEGKDCVAGGIYRPIAAN